ncbi:type IV pilus modification PilV family protein [Ramlibacter sp. MMS24-I3-19]|uniref:type IV pilus modification PilV family protein n=1 Tax=Ramlibacter sp. MMS24-I3-19 TaxID=3416606 RepID=UPI003D02217D
MTRRTLRPRHARRTQRGIALIEALVGILLFCIAILGLVGLQASMTRAQTDAKFRADAAYLANEVVGAIWTDKSNIGNYATAPGAVCSNTRCAAWVNKVAATLPAAAATIVVTPATGTVGLTLTWAPPNEGTHSYVLSTQVQ